MRKEKGRRNFSSRKRGGGQKTDREKGADDDPWSAGKREGISSNEL